MSRNRGLTMIDVLAIALVAALVAFFVVPMFVRQTESCGGRTSCMNNVRNIGMSMFMYAEDHDGRFPPLVDAAGNMVPAVDNEGVVSTLPARSAFAAMLKECYLTTTKVFQCPNSGERRPEGFPDDFKTAALQDLVFAEKNCSYGWDPTKTHSADATCAILADKPPANVSAANEGNSRNNSPNHLGEGQNVFYSDGHVKWGVTPRPDSGDDLDIYTGAAGYEKSATDAKIIR
jgi:hypothetical protein